MTKEILAQKTGALSVICDVSCDPYGEYNPIPIYNQCTHFDKPSIILEDSAEVSLVAIDHLPSLLPRESSEDFCDQLMPTLKELINIEEGVWGRAKSIFEDKTKLLKDIKSDNI